MEEAIVCLCKAKTLGVNYFWSRKEFIHKRTSIWLCCHLSHELIQCSGCTVDYIIVQLHASIKSRHKRATCKDRGCMIPWESTRKKIKCCKFYRGKITAFTHTHSWGLVFTFKTAAFSCTGINPLHHLFTAHFFHVLLFQYCRSCVIPKFMTLTVTYISYFDHSGWSNKQLYLSYFFLFSPMFLKSEIWNPPIKQQVNLCRSTFFIVNFFWDFRCVRRNIALRGWWITSAVRRETSTTW